MRLGLMIIVLAVLLVVVYVLHLKYKKATNYFASGTGNTPITTMGGSSYGDQQFLNEISAFEQKMQGWKLG